MAIFSLRTIQRLINENATFLKVAQTKEFVRKLNKSDESFLGWEWEIVLLNAFSKVGKVVHEPKLKGTNPDIIFHLAYTSRTVFYRRHCDCVG